MGIGADDIFVFTDAWHQSKLVADPRISGSVAGRLDWTYRRAAKAMLITSITDAAAFYSNCLSSLTVVRIFGVFMGTMVLCNYALVVTYFPAVVVIWDKLGAKPQCKKCRKPTKAIDGGGDDADGDVDGRDSGGSREKSAARKRPIERFCEEAYAPAVLGTRKRCVLAIVASILLVSIFGGISTGLSANQTDFKAQSMPRDSTLMQAFDTMSRFEGDRQSIQEVMWVIGLGPDGTKALDRSVADPNNPKDLGKPVFVDGFEAAVSKPAAQQWLLDSCEAFGAAPRVAETAFKPNPIEKSVWCFMRHFRDWAVRLAVGFPVTEAAFVPMLRNFTSMPPNGTAACEADASCSAWYAAGEAFPSTYAQDVCR